MQLFFAPLACSLATRIALYETGVPSQFTYVDLRTKKTEDGGDFLALNPLGQVPTLRTEAGDVLTENAAILQHVAEHAGALAPTDREGRTRLHQWLSFIATELHKGIFALHFDRDATDATREFARKKVATRFARLEEQLAGRDYLLGEFSVADAYLGTILNWTRKTGPDLRDWPVLHAYHQRVLARPAVQRAMAEELPLYAKEVSAAGR